MNAAKITGVVLIVAGILALVYGGFSDTRKTHEAKIGPIELSVHENEQVTVPIWVGVGAVVVGGVVLVLGGKNT